MPYVIRVSGLASIQRQCGGPHENPSLAFSLISPWPFGCFALSLHFPRIRHLLRFFKSLLRHDHGFTSIHSLLALLTATLKMLRQHVVYIYTSKSIAEGSTTQMRHGLAKGSSEFHKSTLRLLQAICYDHHDYQQYSANQRRTISDSWLTHMGIPARQRPALHRPPHSTLGSRLTDFMGPPLYAGGTCEGFVVHLTCMEAENPHL